MADIASSELNLRELRILHALLHERSITRTAELLATTQPGISKVLRHLRAQFADPLFVRNGHAMQPTAKALEIADQVRALLGVADSLRAAATAFDPVRSDRTFSLLLTDVGMIRFLPPLIAHVAAIAPGSISGRCRWTHASSNSSWKPAKPIWRSAPFQKPRAICGVSDCISTAMSPSSASGHPEMPSRAVARRLSRRAAYPRHGVGDRSCRARNRAARARFADSAGEHHVAGAKLHRRRHRRGGNRRARPPCRPIWPSGLQGRLA